MEFIGNADRHYPPSTGWQGLRSVTRDVSQWIRRTCRRIDVARGCDSRSDGIGDVISLDAGSSERFCRDHCVGERYYLHRSLFKDSYLLVQVSNALSQIRVLSRQCCHVAIAAVEAIAN